MLSIEKVKSYWVNSGYWHFMQDIKSGAIKSTEVDLSSCSIETRLEVLEILNNLHNHIICENIEAFPAKVSYIKSYSKRMGGYYFHSFREVYTTEAEEINEQAIDFVKKKSKVPLFKRPLVVVQDWILVSFIIVVVAFILGVSAEKLSNPFLLLF